MIQLIVRAEAPEIEQLLADILAVQTKQYVLQQRQNSHLIIRFTPDQIRRKDMPFQLTDIQQVNASVAEVDAVGNPVAADPGSITWTVADPSILSLVQNADGSATLKAVGPLGKSQVSVSAGAISAQDEIEVVASAATALAIKFSTPE